MLVLLGLNHKTAPVKVRESLCLNAFELPATLAELKRMADIQECLVLSTCNRTEFYLKSFNPDSACSRLTEFWSRLKQYPCDIQDGSFYLLRQTQACRHMFEVASGLDSMVIGEGEILGQLKAAYKLAHQAGAAGKVLGKLALSALSCGKKVQSQTGIRKGISSVSGAALELIRERYGNLDNSKILLIGSGKIGGKTAALLKASGAGEVCLVNRDYAKARALALKLEVACAPWQALAGLVSRSDIILTCTSAPHYILTRDMLAQLKPGRRSKPQIVMDLALPRDVEPGVKELPGLILYDLDGLQAFVQLQMQERMQEIEPARQIVETELKRFLNWHEAHKNAAALKALRQKFDAYRQAMVQKLYGQMPHLSQEDQRSLEKVSRSLTNKLLHPYLIKLKSSKMQEDEELLNHIQEIFKLEF